MKSITRHTTNIRGILVSLRDETKTKPITTERLEQVMTYIKEQLGFIEEKADLVKEVFTVFAKKAE